MISTFEELSRKRVYDGRRKIDSVIYRLPDGSQTDYDVKIESHAAAVLALTKDKFVILASQFRVGPQKIFHELPGGMIDSGEDPSEAAKRELLEETGYSGEMMPTIDFAPCAHSTQRRYCFLALDCEKVSAQNLDDGELVEVTLMTLSDFRDYLLTGDISDSTCAFAALDWSQP